jgi:hypothetical protein
MTEVLTYIKYDNRRKIDDIKYKVYSDKSIPKITESIVEKSINKNLEELNFSISVEHKFVDPLGAKMPKVRIWVQDWVYKKVKEHAEFNRVRDRIVWNALIRMGLEDE